MTHPDTAMDSYALEVGADLALDEASDGRSHRSCATKEGLQLVLDDLARRCGGA